MTAFTNRGPSRAKRPEHIRCIRHTHADKRGLSWCGKAVSNFDLCFQDIDHAAYSAQNGSRLLPCSECVEEIFVNTFGYTL